ncbi:hypothetical protein BLA29_014055, partial [Euroglyphus maynei]
MIELKTQEEFIGEKHVGEIQPELEEPTVTLTEEIIELPDEKDEIKPIEEKEKPKKKKVIRRKSKPDEEMEVTAEEMIDMKPADKISEEQKPEEIQPDIESEVDVETKKKL